MRLPARKRKSRTEALRTSTKRSTHSQPVWKKWGLKIGAHDAGRTSESSDEPHHDIHRMNDYWAIRVRRANLQELPFSDYKKAAESYAEGYCKAKGMPPYNGLLLPTNKSVAAIVSAGKDEAAALRLLQQIETLALSEIICIIGDQNDGLFDKIREKSTATLFYYDEPIDQEICRALGAKLSQSDILLFLDERSEVMAEELLPFINEIEKGTDIALTDVTPYLDHFISRDAVTVTDQFVNYCLGRKDLRANALTAVPHAMTRKACESIGYANLAMPPKAQVSAILQGLRIRPAVSINIMEGNPKRRSDSEEKDDLRDHVEAMRLLIERRGSRLNYPDVRRKRQFAEGGGQHSIDQHHYSKLQRQGNAAKLHSLH